MYRLLDFHHFFLQLVPANQETADGKPVIPFLTAFDSGLQLGICFIFVVVMMTHGTSASMVYGFILHEKMEVFSSLFLKMFLHFFLSIL